MKAENCIFSKNRESARTFRKDLIFVPIGAKMDFFFVNVLKASEMDFFKTYFSNISGFANAMKVILCV